MTSTAIVQQIRVDGAANRRQLIADFLKDASTWRPAGFEVSRRRRRAHYSGEATYYIEKRLEQFFPNTWKNIPVYPYRFAYLSAATVASFYDEQPVRTLVDGVTGEVLEPEHAMSEAFRELIEQSRAAVKLPEADRRAVWMGDSVVAVRARPMRNTVSGEIEQVVRLELHEADAAWVLPDARSPTDLQMARGFCLRVRVTDEDGRATTGYELWTREEGGPWLHSIERLDGDPLTEVEPYGGQLLPFIMLHAEDPDGLPYVERGDDDVTVVEMLNVDMADEAYIAHMQGHTEKVYRGTRKTSTEMVGGPGAILQIDPAEQLDALDYNPKLEALRTAALQRQKTWALTNRINLDAFSIDAQVPESGVARTVKNEPQDKMRRERDALLVEMEEGALWPVAADVWNTFVDPARAITGVRFQVQGRRRPAYEDPEAKQRRLEADLRVGVISVARYAVEMGHFAAIEDAVAAGLPDTLKAAAPAPAPIAGPAPSRFAMRLAEARGDEPAPGGEDEL